MGNLVLNIGPISLTVALFGCATFLLWDGKPEWTSFFNLAVYSGIWSVLWSAAQLILRRTMYAAEDERGSIDSGSVLVLYLLAFFFSVLLTFVLARFIFRAL